MGYHVAILRSGGQEQKIHLEEIIALVEGKFGFTLDRDESGSIKQAYKEVSGEEVLLFYDGIELWAKNPSNVALGVMLEIARALGNKARVRGDEGETYQSITKTYVHPDDADSEEKKIDWKYWLSYLPPVLAGSLVVYLFGRMLLKYLKKTYGFGF